MGGGASKSAAGGEPSAGASGASKKSTGGGEPSAGASAAPAATENDTYGEYKIRFTQKGSLGIRLMSRGAKDTRVYVKSIIAGGQAVPHADIIRPGHLLVGIDGKPCTDLTMHESMALIAKSGG